jgi:hypothetical protein
MIQIKVVHSDYDYVQSQALKYRAEGFSGTELIKSDPEKHWFVATKGEKKWDIDKLK